MQINLTSNPAPGINVSGQVSSGTGLANLAEGDSITCRVIFSGDGTAHLKTSDGALIRARLDGNVTLPEGSQVTLTVEGKTADNITLRIDAVSGAGGGESDAAVGKQAALPPALVAVFEQIQSANLPTAAKVELLTKALADFPSLNTQSPAVQAALASLTSQAGAQASTQVGLGQMLVELAVLISNLENTTAGGNEQQANLTANPAGEGTTLTTPTTAAPTAPATAAPTAPATATTTAPVVEGTAPATATITAPVAEGTAPATATIAAPVAEGTAPATATITAPVAGGTSPVTATITAPVSKGATPVTATINAPVSEGATPVTATINAPIAEGTTPVTATITVPIAEGTAPATAATTAPATAASTAPMAESAATVTVTPPNAPPPEALQTVRQMIGELYPPGSSEPSPKALSNFIERLFAQVGRTVEQGGEQLQKCARELEVRLNLLKEAISQSSLPQREELLGQTNRILQQTEALREARLLCMQIPIQFEQQKQTAELYVYRRERRGGHKLDPQNATILLALNTEHLGRLEALIQTRGKEINLRLEISRAEAVPLVREYSQSLPRLLKEAGFRLNSASVEHLHKERNNPLDAEKALIEYQRNFDGKLDFFV